MNWESLSTSAIPAIAKACSDQSESNREAAIELLAALIDTRKDVLSDSKVVSILLESIDSRLSTPQSEPVEEIRLSLAKLLNAILICGRTSDSFRPLLGQLVDILIAECGDAFPAVKLEAASGVIHLAALLPGSIHLCLGQLVKALLPNLGHQRGPIRLAVLEALQAILPLGGESLPSLLADTVLPSVNILRFDRVVSVRKQLCSLLATVMTRFGSSDSSSLSSDEVTASICSTALYLLACLLSDDTPEVCETALTSLTHAATASSTSAVYVGGQDTGSSAGDHVGDVAVAAQYADVPADTSLDERVSPLDGSTLLTDEDQQAYESALEEVQQLLPFASHGLPSLPVRRLCASPLLPGALQLALSEGADWSGHVRVSACGALRSLMLLAGSAVARVPSIPLSTVVTLLCSRIRSDEDEALARKLAIETAGLMGTLLPPDTWLDGVLLPMLQGQGASSVGVASSSAHQRLHCPSVAAALTILGAALSTAPQVATASHLTSLARTLRQPHLTFVEDEQEEEASGGGGRSSRSRLPAGITDDSASRRKWRDAGPDVRHALASAVQQGVALAVGLMEAETAAAKHTWAAASFHGGLNSSYGSQRQPISGASASSSEGTSSHVTVDADGAAAAAAAAAAAGITPSGVTHDVMDDLLLALLHLQWRGEADGEGAAQAAAQQASHDLAAAYFKRARAHRLLPHDQTVTSTEEEGDSLLLSEVASGPVELYAAAAHRLLPAITDGADNWTARSPGRRELDTLLRIARPALCGRSRREAHQLIARVVAVFTATLAPSWSSPEMRVAQLALLDSFIVGDDSSSGDGGDDRPGAGKPSSPSGVGGGGAVTELSAYGPAHVQRIDVGGTAAEGGTDMTTITTSVGVRRPSLSHLSGAASSLGHIEPTASTATAPLSDEARHALATLDVQPESVGDVRSSSGGSDSAIRAALSGGGAVHSVCTATVDDVLAEEVPQHQQGEVLWTSHASDLASCCLIPHMVWKVGGVAATLRKVAAACVLSLLRRGLLRPRALSSLLPSLLPVVTTCAGDDDAVTRNIAVMMVRQLVDIAPDAIASQQQVLALVTLLLGRLDDPSDPVRISTCGAVGALAQPYARHCARTDTSNSGHKVVEALVLHVDDPAPAIQSAAIDSLALWAPVDPAFAAQLIRPLVSSGARLPDVTARLSRLVAS